MIWFCFYANIFAASQGACIVFGHEELTMTTFISLDIVSDTSGFARCLIVSRIGETMTEAGRAENQIMPSAVACAITAAIDIEGIFSESFGVS
jgi:hypothetical protein